MHRHHLAMVPLPADVLYTVWGALFIGSVANAVYVFSCVLIAVGGNSGSIGSLFGIFCLQCHVFLKRWEREKQAVTLSVSGTPFPALRRTNVLSRSGACFIVSTYGIQALV